jgi:transposase-like protein
MDRDWLEAQLTAGRSIESIAREVGKHPSTVAYHAKKHGLQSAHAAKHAARGGVEREELLELVERGMSMRQIGAELGLSYGAVQYWLEKHGLITEPHQYSRRDAEKTSTTFRECAKHGWTVFVRSGARGYYRCPQCTAGRVAEYRRRIKRQLVEEAGGRCVLCGYDAYTGALQFHHIDPAQKRFGLAKAGLTRPLDQVREEARKCVLLCGNCHAEVEAGLVEVALPADAPG